MRSHSECGRRRMVAGVCLVSISFSCCPSCFLLNPGWLFGGELETVKETKSCELNRDNF